MLWKSIITSLKIVSSRKIKISKYTKVSLFEALDQEAKKCGVKIDELMAKLENNLPVELMLDSLKQDKYTEIEQQDSLEHAISIYGISNFNMWISQQHFYYRKATGFIIIAFKRS
jgi:hypothetical protein